MKCRNGFIFFVGFCRRVVKSQKWVIKIQNTYHKKEDDEEHYYAKATSRQLVNSLRQRNDENTQYTTPKLRQSHPVKGKDE